MRAVPIKSISTRQRFNAKELRRALNQLHCNDYGDEHFCITEFNFRQCRKPTTRESTGERQNDRPPVVW
jgi:hypothetical protein